MNRRSEATGCRVARICSASSVDRDVVVDDLACEIVVAIGERLHRERDLRFAAPAHRA
jgi:hypothetical protein